MSVAPCSFTVGLLTGVHRVRALTANSREWTPIVSAPFFQTISPISVDPCSFAVGPLTGGSSGQGFNRECANGGANCPSAIFPDHFCSLLLALIRVPKQPWRQIVQAASPGLPFVISAGR